LLLWIQIIIGGQNYSNRLQSLEVNSNALKEWAFSIISPPLLVQCNSLFAYPQQQKKLVLNFAKM
jgi:hypothetical protein